MWSHALRAVIDGGKDAADPPRLLLTAKAAFAAALAWYLAPWVPFADDEYSYYAPLGALVSMYPTTARSARFGVETLVGVGIGIALGIGGLFLTAQGAPGIVAIAVVVGAGVFLGGVRALGAGREWAAIAGLFTLLLSGGDVEEFSTSYLVTMAFGVVVGVTVNLLVFPPLYLRRASSRLATLRSATADHLRALAEGVADGAPSVDDLERDLHRLTATSAAVSEEVRAAGESRTANPRAWRRGHEHDGNRQRFHALERIVFLTRDLADVLLHVASTDDALRAGVREPLAEALGRVATLIDTPAGDPSTGDRIREATTALDAFVGAVDARGAGSTAELAADAAAYLCLRRMIDEAGARA